MIEITTNNNCHWWCYTEDGMLEALVPTYLGRNGTGVLSSSLTALLKNGDSFTSSD